jgi:hypothetical protein
VFTPFLDEDEQLKNVRLGDAVFVLDSGAAQDVGDLGAITGSEITARKLPCRNALSISAGNPAGFRRADTPILVSRTALIATFLFPDFLYRVGDV